MNQDHSICTQARRLLYISDENLQELINTSQQQYFYPDISQKFDATLDYFRCAVCNEIPLDLQECKNCKEVICKTCQKPECPSCHQEEGYENVLHQKLRKLVSNLTENHSCKVDFEDSEKAPGPDQTSPFNIFDLNHHIKHLCPKSMSCFSCKRTFSSVINFHTHLQFDCNHVSITCSDCEQQFQRYEFKLHPCFLANKRTLTSEKEYEILQSQLESNQKFLEEYRTKLFQDKLRVEKIQKELNWLLELKLERVEGQQCPDCEKKVKIFPVSEYEEYKCKGCQQEMKQGEKVYFCGSYNHRYCQFCICKSVFKAKINEILKI